MTIGPQTTLRDLAFIVCTALESAGTTVVLSGGGAATIYAPEVYQSRDLDFILSYWSSFGRASAAPLLDLGFREQGGTYYHDLTPYTVEFPQGPLAVGNEVIVQWDTLREGDYLLHILSPTDCVRDRLAWFLFDNDYSALEQALGVAASHPIDIDKIRAWCDSERQPQKFEIFHHRLKEKQ